jgi:hypothetical protein
MALTLSPRRRRRADRYCTRTIGTALSYAIGRSPDEDERLFVSDEVKMDLRNIDNFENNAVDLVLDFRNADIAPE